jgi:hypothetical protein
MGIIFGRRHNNGWSFVFSQRDYDLIPQTYSHFHDRCLGGANPYAGKVQHRCQDVFHKFFCSFPLENIENSNSPTSQHTAIVAELISQMQKIHIDNKNFDAVLGTIESIGILFHER